MAKPPIFFKGVFIMYFYRDIILHYFEEKYYNDFLSLTPVERNTRLFVNYLNEIPLHLEPGDQIAGHFGYKDVLPAAVAETIERYKKRKQREQQEQFNAMTGPDNYYTLAETYSTHGSPGIWGHHTLNYESILKKGLRGYIYEIKKELEATPAGEESKRAYLKAMITCLEAGRTFASRFAAPAEYQLRAETDKKEILRLKRIIAACRKVPHEPATDFFEALQALFLLREMDDASDHMGASISFGSFDQFMYPYYLASRKKGVTDDEMEVWLLSLFKLLDDYDGQDCVISVGYQDENGRDHTNELSALLIRAEKKNKLRAPLFVARVSSSTPDDVLLSMMDAPLFEKGQPTFYSEEGCRKAIMCRGEAWKPEYAQKYCINSCMGMMIPGMESPTLWGGLMNMHLPLELAINYGSPLMGMFPFHMETEPVLDFENVEELFSQYEKYLRELFVLITDYNKEKIVWYAANDPNPFVSALMPHCVKAGKDRWDNGGSDFRTVTLECFCFGMAADAITAIDKLVFREKKHTIEEFIAAAQNNYEGYEQLRNDILACPKYGSGDPVAEANAQRVMNMAADICESLHYDNLYYLPSLHTLTYDVIQGRKIYASLDGRLSGHPINKNAGPANTVRSLGPTVTAMSAAGLPQERMSGGQAIDLYFPSDSFAAEEKRKKVATLVKTYLLNGGLQINVNSLSAETLQKAFDKPWEYPDLIVRIGGHSRYFKEMRDDVRREFIQRFAIEGSVRA